jgi:tetratricopeptide (TPR) repeat protein
MVMHPMCRHFLVVLVISVTLLAGASAATQTPASDSDSADHLVELGQQHLSGGAEGVERAIELFEAALAVELDHVPALVGLSNAYRMKAPWDRGDRSGLDPAIAFGQKATYLAPDDAEAIRYGEALLERDAANVDHLIAAAMANWYAGHDPAAITLFERVMQAVSGEDPTIGWWMTYASTPLGDLYMKNGRHDEAEALLDRSEAAYLDRNREAGEGWGYMYDLARIYASRGERAEALRWLRQAVRFGFPELYLAKVDPTMSALQGDPEYERLLQDLEERIRAMRASVDERR